MDTTTQSLAKGVNLIVKNFLVAHVGANPSEMKTEITEDIAIVLIRGLLPPAERGLRERNGITVASYHELREHLFKKSEHVLWARIAEFLQRGIKRIHYIFGTQPEDLIIVIYLEPL